MKLVNKHNKQQINIVISLFYMYFDNKYFFIGTKLVGIINKIL